MKVRVGEGLREQDEERGGNSSKRNVLATICQML